jgi:deazaflavin-dependent oxidoreductase (nitroreductase family)
LARTPIQLYHLRLGLLLGHRFLLLQHTGRTSGLPRLVVLEVVARPGSGRYVVAAGLGPRSDWYRNITARPAVRVSVGRERLVPGTARPLDQKRATVILTDYDRRHPLAWRVLAPLLGRFLGLRGLTAAQLAERIPLVEIETRPLRSPGRADPASNLTTS